MFDPSKLPFLPFFMVAGEIVDPIKTRQFSILTKRKPLESSDSSGVNGSCHRGFEPRASTSGEWRASTALMAHDNL